MSKDAILTAGRPSSRSGHKIATLASLSDDSGKKRVNFDLTTEQHMKLKLHAARQGKSIKDVFVTFLAGLPSE